MKVWSYTLIVSQDEFFPKKTHERTLKLDYFSNSCTEIPGFDTTSFKKNNKKKDVQVILK